MQYRPPGTMVSARRGAETHRFDGSDAAHLTQNPYASVLGLFWLMVRSFVTVRHVWEALMDFYARQRDRKQNHVRPRF